MKHLTHPLHYILAYGVVNWQPPVMVRAIMDETEKTVVTCDLRADGSLDTPQRRMKSAANPNPPRYETLELAQAACARGLSAFALATPDVEAAQAALALAIQNRTTAMHAAIKGETN